MNLQTDPHAHLRAAFVAGHRIQAWHLNDGAANSNDGRWDTLTPPDGRAPEFGCAPHLYRVHPDDQAKAEYERTKITVWQINEMEWFVGAGTPESMLAWYMEEHALSHEDATGDEDEFPRALSDHELDTLKFRDCDENERPTGIVRTFREQLAIEIAEGGTFPRLFASTEC